jgi:hypothetical protein
MFGAAGKRSVLVDSRIDVSDNRDVEKNASEWLIKPSSALPLFQNLEHVQI